MPAGAALGGRSAAAVLGAPAPTYGDPVTVVVPAGGEGRGPAGGEGPPGATAHRRRPAVRGRAPAHCPGQDGVGRRVVGAHRDRRGRPRRAAAPGTRGRRPAACCATGPVAGALDGYVGRSTSWTRGVRARPSRGSGSRRIRGEYHFDGLQIARDDVRLARLVAA